MIHKKTAGGSLSGSGLNLFKGITLMLVMALVVMGCDSIVDQQTEADSAIETSDISGVLSVDTPPVTCIDPDADEYHVVSESKTVEWGNRRNPFEKTVEIEYYNTLTEFVLRVKSTEMIADVLVDDESIKNFDGTVAAGTWQKFTIDLDEGDTQSFSLKVTGSGPPAYFEVDYTLLGECVRGCGEVTFTYNGSPVTYGTVTGANGSCWLDRNLGASRVAESSTDPEAYGDLFQWGRLADGHQIRTSGTTTDLSSTDTPGHGDFILAPTSPFDWRSPQNDDLWNEEDGIIINNPCPVGFRLPTDAEWNAERQIWSSNNAAGAFNSPLKLPVAGDRYGSSGSLLAVGSGGVYWSGTVSGILARYLAFNSSNAGMGSSGRAGGFSVRCLK